MSLGQHLKVKFKAKGIPYWHHGIDIGSDHVVHLSRATGTVTKSTLASFSKGKSVQVVYHLFSPYSSEEVAKRASSKVGLVRYKFIRNNCEHFAEWAATDEKKSKQIRAGVKAAVLVGALLGAGTVAGAKWLRKLKA